MYHFLCQRIHAMPVRREFNGIRKTFHCIAIMTSSPLPQESLLWPWNLQMSGSQRKPVSRAFLLYAGSTHWITLAAYRGNGFICCSRMSYQILLTFGLESSRVLSLAMKTMKLSQSFGRRSGKKQQWPSSISQHHLFVFWLISHQTSHSSQPNLGLSGLSISLLEKCFKKKKYYDHMCELGQIMKITLQFRTMRDEIDDIEKQLIKWVKRYEK